MHSSFYDPIEHKTFFFDRRMGYNVRTSEVTNYSHFQLSMNMLQIHAPVSDHILDREIPVEKIRNEINTVPSLGCSDVKWVHFEFSQLWLHPQRVIVCVYMYQGRLSVSSVSYLESSSCLCPSTSSLSCVLFLFLVRSSVWCVCGLGRLWTCVVWPALCCGRSSNRTMPSTLLHCL